MKKIIIIFSIAVFGLSANAQVLSNGQVVNQFANENVFLDASTLNNGTINDGKGLLFPTTDLSLFTFKIDNLDGINFPSYFDGMVVYNTATSGSTADPLLTNQTANLVSGFYYFSNPNGSLNGTVTAGRWLPIAGAGNGIKTKEVLVTTPVVYNEAKLDLGTSVIGVSEVGTFLGAKIYEAGKLIMTADSDYITATNVLTTGNGYMFQLLKANTQYKVVVEYK